MRKHDYDKIATLGEATRIRAELSYNLSDVAHPKDREKVYDEIDKCNAVIRKLTKDLDKKI